MKEKYLSCIGSLLLVLMTGLPASAQSQEEVETRKHQISFGIPLLPVQEIVTGISAIASDIVGQDVDDIKAKGAYSLSYRFFPNPRLGVGVTGIYQRIDVNYKNPTAKSTFNTIAILANGQYNYLMKSKFDLYSRVGVGICNFNQSGGVGNSSDNAFAFQVTAIGIRGGGTFSSFVEAGFGYEGILHVGFCLRL